MIIIATKEVTAISSMTTIDSDHSTSPYTGFQKQLGRSLAIVSFVVVVVVVVVFNQ